MSVTNPTLKPLPLEDAAPELADEVELAVPLEVAA
jgi:hypothetical protein